MNNKLVLTKLRVLSFPEDSVIPYLYLSTSLFYLAGFVAQFTSASYTRCSGRPAK